jgi:hypothetical protein
MEICGASISDGRATYLAFAAISCAVLLVLWPLAVWMSGRYQRAERRPETRWRSREEREDLKDD